MRACGRSKKRTLSRKEFLRISGILAGLAAVRPGRSLVAAPTLPRPTVVHTYCERAVDWDFDDSWWGDHVIQSVVSEMVDRGVMELTARQTRADAWNALIPYYVSGQRVAIKANFNNARSLDDSDNVIDAAIEPVNAVIAGLIEIGVAESDIWIYDAVRFIPIRFRSGCPYSAVQFSGSSPNPQGFSTTQKVTFQPPLGGPALADQRISNVLVDADYLINMPIMKKHGAACVTLSFKNHFGSIQNCSALHGYTFPDYDDYTSAYSALVDIHMNPNFGPKTILTIGDGLYGSRGTQGSVPERWTTFSDGAPRSLFFSRDPVAIDSVMYDFLEAEAGVQDHGDDYLALAASAGLGVFEHRASGASSREKWYSQIDYRYLDMDQYVKLRGRWRDGTAYLYWNKPLHPDLGGYRLRYLSDSGGDVDQGSSPIPITDPNQLDYQLTELTDYCMYEVWIEPYDGVGDAIGESNRVPLMASDIVQHLPLVSAG